MYKGLSIKKNLLTLLYATALVWVILLGFEWGSTYFENQKQTAYEEVPFELKLKAAPKDVIYSEAYSTESGTQIVKYAYLTDEVPPILDEDISRRTPVSQTVVLETFKSDEGESIETLKTTFLSKPQMYQDGGKWRQIEYATTSPEIFSMSGVIPYIKRRELAERIFPGTPAFATVSTFYPDPNTETTSVDGIAQESEAAIDNLDFIFACANAWTNVKSGPGDTSDDSSAIFSVYTTLTTNFTGPSDYECTATIVRAIVLFDTAALPDAASISGTTLALYVVSKVNQDNDGTDTVNIFSSAPASNTAVVNGDYDSLGATSYATAIDISSITTTAYNTFTLNTDGRNAISKTSVTKLGIMEGHDFGDSAIDQDLGSQVTFSAAEQTGTSQDPKLDVTYTVPTDFSMGSWFPF